MVLSVDGCLLLLDFRRLGPGVLSDVLSDTDLRFWVNIVLSPLLRMKKPQSEPYPLRTGGRLASSPRSILRFSPDIVEIVFSIRAKLGMPKFPDLPVPGGWYLRMYAREDGNHLQGRPYGVSPLSSLCLTLRKSYLLSWRTKSSIKR